MGIRESESADRSSVLGLNVESFRYSGAQENTLNAMNLDLAQGSLTAIAGDSGSGKSTLGEVLAGLLPRHGMDELNATFQIAGQQIIHEGSRSPRVDVASWAQHVGMLPQDAAHYLSGIRETVAEELAFSLENAGMPREQMAERIMQVSEKLSLDHLLQREPSQLSGGQQRLVALAAMAISNPELMVLDEPLAGLDADASTSVRAMINALRAQGTAMLILCTEADQWVSEADNLWSLEAGELHELDAQRHVYRSGHEPTRSGPIADSAPVLVDFTKVHLGYLGTAPLVIEGLDLTVRTGECVGLAGANGSGKSTILKGAAGSLQATSGVIRMNGETGLLLQNPSDQLFERSVHREVSFGLPKKSAQRSKVPEVLAQLGLSAYADTHPYELPVSARRLVALATVLVHEPQILLLDEPTEALDRKALEILQDVIDSVLARGGAVLFSSHDQRFMNQTAHRVIRL